MYEKELITLGLSEKEATIYETALGMGPETAQNLAIRSGINRATTYVQIESLKQKGLMSEFEKGKKTYYMAESPERLDSLINNAQQQINFHHEELKRILPHLSNIFSHVGIRPQVRFLEGIEAVRTLSNEFLKIKNKTVHSIINLDNLLKTFPEHEKNYSSHRIQNKIIGHVIYTRKEGPLSGATDPIKLRIAKYIDPEKFPISAGINIFDNKVAIITYKEKPITVIIEDKEITQTLRSIFNVLWESLP